MTSRPWLTATPRANRRCCLSKRGQWRETPFYLSLLRRPLRSLMTNEPNRSVLISTCTHYSACCARVRVYCMLQPSLIDCLSGCCSRLLLWVDFPFTLKTIMVQNCFSFDSLQCARCSPPILLSLPSLSLLSSALSYFTTSDQVTSSPFTNTTIILHIMFVCPTLLNPLDWNFWLPYAA